MSLDVVVAITLNRLTGVSRALDGMIVFFASYLPYALGAGFFVFLFAADLSSQGVTSIFFVTLFITLVARFGIATSIHFLWRRPRPSVAHDIRELVHQRGSSFPSGHATFFFAMAAAVYGYNAVWGSWFFLGALLVSMARVVAGAHYPSDVAAGLLIGIGVAYGAFIIL